MSSESDPLNEVVVLKEEPLDYVETIAEYYAEPSDIEETKKQTNVKSRKTEKGPHSMGPLVGASEPDPDWKEKDKPLKEKKTKKQKLHKKKKTIKKEIEKKKVKKHKQKRNTSIKKEKRTHKKRIFLIAPDYKVSKEIEELTNSTPYYACAACDEKFYTADKLQKHVQTHLDRWTSYNHRAKNQELREKLKKEHQKIKNLKSETNENKDTANTNEVVIKKEVLDPEYMDNIINDTDITQEINNCSLEISNILEQIEEVETDRLVTKMMKVKVKTEETDNLEKIFKCGVCSKQFTLNYYLRLHVRSHTGEKPYKCADCPSSFVTASHLGRHRKRSHLSIRYICRICRRTYSRLEFLQKHFNKQHAADKIDGEPYDYNAILPYLKELEMEMEAKKLAEAEEKRLRAEQEAMEMISCPELVREELERPVEVSTDVASPVKTITEDQTPQSVGNDDIPAAAGDDEEEVYLDEDYLDEPDDGSWPEEPSFIEITPDSPVVSVKEEKTKVKKHKKLRKTRKKAPLTLDDDKSEIDKSFLDSLKEDSTEDEDYFPNDTWVPDVDVSDSDKPLKRAKRHKKGEELVCPHCKKLIKSSAYLKIHIRTHTGERPYKCDICTKRFITASKMNRHLLTHSLAEREALLERKVKLENLKEEEEIPEPPRQKRRRRKKIEMGLPRIKVERPFKCEFCTRTFVYNEAMLLHKLVHTNEVTTFTCAFCLLSFEDSAALSEHEREHTGPRPYLCTMCGKDYKSKDSMIYHRRTHTAEKKFQCDICPKSFDAQSKLDRHLICHRAEKFTMRYECPVCAHMFKTKWHIEMHLQSHEREGVILAENRGHLIAMVLQNARKIPLESEGVTLPIPKDERSRVCNICGETFHHFYFLEQHLKTHGTKFSIENTETKEERKHICKVCNKGFKLSYYLKLHTYTHSKEKPYICQQCGKGFITRGKLNRHIESHTGLKKYQCHVCCKFFTRPSYLRIHVRTIHGTQDYNLKFDAEFSEFALNVIPASSSLGS